MSQFFGNLAITINLVYIIALYQASRQLNNLRFRDFFALSSQHECTAWRLFRDKAFYLQNVSLYTRLVRYLFLPSYISILLYFISLFFD